MADEVFADFVDRIERIDMNPWDHKYVRRGLRMEVVEGNAIFVS